MSRMMEMRRSSIGENDCARPYLDIHQDVRSHTMSNATNVNSAGGIHKIRSKLTVMNLEVRSYLKVQATTSGISTMLHHRMVNGIGH